MCACVSVTPVAICKQIMGLKMLKPLNEVIQNNVSFNRFLFLLKFHTAAVSKHHSASISWVPK